VESEKQKTGKIDKTQLFTFRSSLITLCSPDTAPLCRLHAETFEKCHFEERDPIPDVISRSASDEKS
jgi:hypothetical protein